MGGRAVALRPSMMPRCPSLLLGWEAEVAKEPGCHWGGQAIHSCKMEIVVQSRTFDSSPVAKAPYNSTVPAGEGTGWIAR